MHKLIITPRPAPVETAVDGPALQLRSKVFETNSSSSHSLTLSPELLNPQPLPAETLRSGKLEVAGGDYGWEWYRYYLPVNKINYLAAHALQHTNARSTQQALETPAFARLCEVVKSHTGCELTLAANFAAEIDHQSEGCCKEVLADRDAMHRLIFDADSYVETGNDNWSRPWEIKTDKGPEFSLHRQLRQSPPNSVVVKFSDRHPIRRELHGLWFSRPGGRRGRVEHVLISHLVNPELAHAISTEGVMQSVLLCEPRKSDTPEKGEMAQRGLQAVAAALGVPESQPAVSACLITQHRQRRSDVFLSDIEIGMCLPVALYERILAREETPIALAEHADLAETMSNIARYNGGLHSSDRQERFSALARKHPGLPHAVAQAIAAGAAEGGSGTQPQDAQPGAAA